MRDTTLRHLFFHFRETLFRHFTLSLYYALFSFRQRMMPRRQHAYMMFYYEGDMPARPSLSLPLPC